MVSKSKSFKRENLSIALAIASLALYILVDFHKKDFIAICSNLPWKLTDNVAFYAFAFPIKISIGALSLKIAGEKNTQIRTYLFTYLGAILLYIISIRLFYVKAFTECLYYIVNVPILEFHFLIALTLKNKINREAVKKSDETEENPT